MCLLRHRLPRRAARCRSHLRTAPATWTRRFGLRRFGFHGLSHGLRRTAAPRELTGNSAPPTACGRSPATWAPASSLAAVRWTAGRVDTTMGFTPLEGLVMATRAGKRRTPACSSGCCSHGGLVRRRPGLGRAGVRRESLAWTLWPGCADGSGDLRDVQVGRRRRGTAGARLALDVHAHRLRRADRRHGRSASDGLDVLVFTGGIGEHQRRRPAPRRPASSASSASAVHPGPQRHRPARDCDITAPRRRGPHPGRHRARRHRDRPPDPRPARRELTGCREFLVSSGTDGGRRSGRG